MRLEDGRRIIVIRTRSVARRVRGRGPCATGPSIVAREIPSSGWNYLVGIVNTVHGQTDLLEVVDRLGSGSGLANLLDSRHQQCDKDGNDCNHHQELNEGEA